MKRFFAPASLLLALGIMSGATAAANSDYPNRTVNVVVPFPAGSGTDSSARLVLSDLAEELDQTFVVSNKPGAGGTIGAMEVVRANPDGYTLFYSSNSPAAANVALYKELPYDPATDLAPIAGVGASALVLMVPTDHPAQNLEEFIEWAKNQPEAITAGYGSSSTQISIGVLGKMADIDVMPVPYKGVPHAINDTLAGIVDFTFVDIGNALAQANGGNLRGLGLTSAKASGLAPHWPPLSETLPGFDVAAWLALFGPADLPDNVVETLNSALEDILATDSVRERLAAVGLQPMYLSADDLGEYVESEIIHWQQMAEDANIEPM